MHSFTGAYDLNERLLGAVHTGHYEETLSCLMQGAKASAISSSCGRTALGTAALVGDAEILELLIQSCEEPDLDIFRTKCSNSTEFEINTTPDGMDGMEWEDEFNSDNGDEVNDMSTNANEEPMEEHTLLYYYYAKTFERTGAFVTNLDELCVKRNCNTLRQDPHTVDAMSMSPLHYAAACGHLDCTRILLEHGGRVDVLNSNGYTPLHVGAEYSEVTRMLLKHGANPNLKTYNTGETAMHLALRNRCPSVANLILESNRMNINETDDIDQTPLMCAIANDLGDIAFELINRGARINLQDKEGHSALYYAVMKNNVSLAACLLKHGARRITSHYLLHHCVRFDLQNMIEVLLNHGDCMNGFNARNQEGLTPIQLAILVRKPNILEYLLKVAHGYALQGKCMVAFENELIIAVQYIESLMNFRPIARILFAFGDGCWMKPSSVVLSSSSTCYIPFCHTPLARAIVLHKLDIAEFLIKEGVDISQICPDHVVNSLRSMVAPGYAEFSKLLVHAGFKFPYYKSAFPTNWKPERRQYEEEMRQLCAKPLSLQSLTRLRIRRHLMKVLNDSVAFKKERFRATPTESSLGQMISQLEIPNVLQKFLIDFADCPTVINYKKEQQQ